MYKKCLELLNNNAAFAIVNSEGEIKVFEPGCRCYNRTSLRKQFNLAEELDAPITKVVTGAAYEAELASRGWN